MQEESRNSSLSYGGPTRKRGYWLLAVCVLGFVCLGAANGYFLFRGADDAPTPGAPCGLELEGKEIVLGTCQPGAVKRFRLLVRNRMDRPYRIVGCVTSCSCVAYGELPRQIDPGGAAAIPISIHLPSRPGDHVEHIKLYADVGSLAVLGATVRARVTPGENLRLVPAPEDERGRALGNHRRIAP